MHIVSIISGILFIIGSLGLFLYGMKLMSENLQKIAGNKMRTILAKMTSKPINGILTGILVTTVIQSSSATTVMVVSFVNAGLMSLADSIGVIMGANIGTTVTAWIITIFGFEFSMSQITIPLIALALPLMLSSKTKRKTIGEFMIGFALLFLGLDFMKDSFPDIDKYPAVLEFISHFSSFGYASILLFVILGACLTVVVQSSSAMMAITLIMCNEGWIGFDVAIAFVIGQNIGTTITANIAAAMANVQAKKAARAHFVFNVIGCILSLLFFYPIAHLIANISNQIMGISPYDSPTSIPIALSIFHTIFNISNTLILVWFIPQIIKIVNWMVKNPEEDPCAENFRLKYIPNHFVNTSELDIESAQQEIQMFSERVLRMYTFIPDMNTAATDNEFDDIIKRTAKYEEITDRMELEIAKFLTHLSEGVISKEGSKKISAMLRIIDNLESIGDGIYHLSILKQSQRTQGVSFGKVSEEHLQKMYDLVKEALRIMDVNLHHDFEEMNITPAYNAEQKINEYRNLLRDLHWESIKAGTYSYEVGTLYSSMYALYEKTGDYIINISEAIGKSQRTIPTIDVNPMAS